MINAPQRTEAGNQPLPAAHHKDAARGVDRSVRRDEASSARAMDAGSSPRRKSRQPSAAKLCLWLGLLALSAALLGSVVNSLLTGWMAVAGMAAIGLFYLGLSSVAAEQMQSSVNEPADDSSPDSNGEAP